MGTDRGGLIRLALALYPRPVRERYGAELADLLNHSPTPRRDLVDVAWCALADRGESLAMSQLRSGLLRITALASAPIAVLIAWGIVFALPLPLLNLLPDAQGPAIQGFITAWFAVSVLTVTVTAMWLGRRSGSRRPLVAPAFVVPSTLAAGAITVASVPYVRDVQGNVWSASVVSTVFWCLATIVLASSITTLLRLGRARVAALTAASGALVILDLTFVIDAVLSLPAGYASMPSALWWYPATITGVDFGLVQSPNGELGDALRALPIVLTACTAFALAAVTATVSRQSTALKPGGDLA
jgi:hypothetical protein